MTITSSNKINKKKLIKYSLKITFLTEDFRCIIRLKCVTIFYIYCEIFRFVIRTWPWDRHSSDISQVFFYSMDRQLTDNHFLLKISFNYW